jgi:hypothetical protein
MVSRRLYPGEMHTALICYRFRGKADGEPPPLSRWSIAHNCSEMVRCALCCVTKASHTWERAGTRRHLCTSGEGRRELATLCSARTNRLGSQHKAGALPRD